MARPKEEYAKEFIDSVLASLKDGPKKLGQVRAFVKVDVERATAQDKRIAKEEGKAYDRKPRTGFDASAFQIRRALLDLRLAKKVEMLGPPGATYYRLKR